MEVRILAIAAEVAFDRRGVALEAQIEVPFPEIRLEVRLDTSASESQVSALQQAPGRHCPVATLLRSAGTRLLVSLRVNPD